MATHIPGHATRPNANRALMDGGGLGDDDIGGDDIGDAIRDDIGNAGGLGGLGGAGGLGGISDLGGGIRALRGVDDELENDGTAMNGNDEVVVVGGRTVVRGGAVVARPGPRRWYY
ncbi:hypothetical protein GN244_ATG05070 [Phytophthora infestans]|uniref:Uncharacterized protein n=1 Tax=Phytophthora infestans TaxID=4787 RepID=A0A833SZE3_PHYIN|nr:hypothetical protein GN244_ATG05070 [Phytophthora infestans]KAF4127954.1 hypothetical protein GN958_ATG22782 [Phytophthora infestans]